MRKNTSIKLALLGALAVIAQGQSGLAPTSAIDFARGNRPSALRITRNQVDILFPGSTRATYTILVSNAASAGATRGTVAVADTIPSGLTLLSMTGSGWTCEGSTCTRTDPLSPGASYPPITVVVSGAAEAIAQVTNHVTVSDGASANGLSAGPATGSQPLAVSVAPAAGSGNSQTFSFLYSDPAGGADLAAAYASVNNGMTGCEVQADPVHGLLYLLNDAQTAWLGPVTAGALATLQNSQCVVNGTGSGIAVANNQVTLSLALAFTDAFIGPKSVYGYAQSAAGLNSGWIQLGTWTVPGSRSPQAVSVTPASGSGLSQTFSFVFADPYGSANLAWGYAMIGNGRVGCQVQADLVQGLLYLLNDAGPGWLGPIALGRSLTVENNECSVSAAGSGILVTGGQVTLNLALAFKPALAGSNTVSGFAQSAGGLNSSWVPLGTWTVAGTTFPPQVVSGTPAAGSGNSQQFTFVFSDQYGAWDLAWGYASINNGQTACMVRADITRSQLYLLNDAMTAWLGPAQVGPGPYSPLQNSQCVVTAANSQILLVGTSATLSLALTFQPAFVGPKNVYGFVQSLEPLDSGWVWLGTWTVPGLAPQAVSVTPSSGSGVSQTFSFVYSDTAGSADLAFVFASINNGVTSCMVQADLVHGSLYLLNDAMTGWLGPIAAGTPSSLQNSQCTLSAAGSSVAALSATQLTLNLALTFKAAFAGTKSVFGYAQTASGLTSGWTPLGAWTITAAQAPQVVSVSPASGTGSSRTFNFVYSDPYGGSELASTYASINNGVSACMVQADMVHGWLYLLNDAMTGWLGPIAAGTATTLQNSQCTVSGTGAGVVLSGNQATVSLPLTFFLPSFAGPKNVFGYAQSAGGLTSGWIALGTWTVQ